MSFITRISRMFFTSPPVKFLIRSSKHIILPGFKGIPLYDVLKFFFQKLSQPGLTDRASSISFNFLLAIPPALIFFLTLVPYFPIPGQFIEEIYKLIREVIPGEKNNTLIISFVKDFLLNPRTDLLSIGILLALFYASNAMIGIMRCFNQDYPGFKKRTIFQERFIAIELTIILFIIILISITLLAMQGNVLRWLGIKSSNIVILISIARWIIFILLFFYSISFIYRIAPATHKKWRLLNPGSILATFLMLSFLFVFSYWVTNFGSYNKLYGSIGTILVIMLLIYFNSFALLLGFEFNNSIHFLKHQVDKRNNINIEPVKI
jgi:membrane protein